MILLAALILGLLAGLAAARWQGVPYQAPQFRHIWLLPVSMLPQLAAVYGPAREAPRAAPSAAVLLMLSLLGFAAFAWLNRRFPGMAVLLIGLVLNMAVMAANGGWMPISPEIARHLPGGRPAEAALLGARADDKSVLMRPEDTRLEFLADRFLIPEVAGYRAAVSLGDMLIAVGAFWLLAAPASRPKPNME